MPEPEDTGGWPATLSGGCHCGAVVFKVTVARMPALDVCNCSICQRSNYRHLLVSAADFELECGADQLISYRFNTGAANHLFCRNCGVKAFYVPRSHPDGYSVNARCLMDLDLEACEAREFDGRHFEDNIAALLTAVPRQ